MSARELLRSSAEPASEAALVARARTGDGKAFAAIYNQHADYIHGLISRLVGPVADCDDLLQDVFVRFHGALAKFRGESSVRTFVSRIAVNRAHDHLRRRMRRHEELTAELEASVAHAIDNRKDLAIACDHVVVLRCLERIKPKKRVAFILRVACELSYGEMAEILDVKPDAARQRVGHARRELAKLLAREGYDE